jgi:hypothetical protein
MPLVNYDMPPPLTTVAPIPMVPGSEGEGMEEEEGQGSYETQDGHSCSEILFFLLFLLTIIIYG